MRGPVAWRHVCGFARPRRPKSCGPAKSGLPRSLPTGSGGLSGDDGVSLRAFSWNIDGDIGYILNPVIVENASEFQELGDEGCLSVPGLWYPCERPLYARAEGTDLDGNKVVVEGEDIWARLINHEVDHLDGKLYIDRLSRDSRKKAMRELRETLDI